MPAAQAEPCVQKLALAVGSNAGFVLSGSASTRTGEQSAPTDAGRTATYTVSGTTLDYSVTLLN
ncbi:hypothetical protein [Streptomyces antibioticus]|uniref:hypothetical protein n=1 Tax=Streptomyces antibioticus TaxID=1890 RepID=UPI0033B740E9